MLEPRTARRGRLPLPMMTYDFSGINSLISLCQFSPRMNTDLKDTSPHPTLIVPSGVSRHGQRAAVKFLVEPIKSPFLSSMHVAGVGSLVGCNFAMAVKIKVRGSKNVPV